jgi:hypothetical protein
MRATTILIAAAAAAAPAHADGVLRSYRDWQVGCDNVRQCRAIGFPRQEGTFGTALIVDREGAPDAAPRVRLRLDRDLHATLPRPVEFFLLAEGRQIARIALAQPAVEPDEAADETIAFERGELAAVLGALRRAPVLQIARGEPRQVVADISLDGASAALLFVDERQQRLGTVTALVRTGDRPARSIPPPPPPPLVPARPVEGAEGASAVPPEPVMALFRAEPGDTCAQDDPQRVEPIVERLGPALVLYGVGCWRGAYNFSHAFYFYYEGPSPRAERAAFRRPIVDAGDGTAENVLTLPDLDRITGTMTHFSKGRGLGDCGSSGAWRFDGREFVPLRYATMPSCRGLLADDWFEVYRTRE